MNRIVRFVLVSIALACTSAATNAQADKSLLGGGLFGYASGNVDNGLQDKYVVETASNPEKIYDSKKVRRSGNIWALPMGSQIDPDALKYTFKGTTASLTQYLDATRTTGLLIIKDGKIVFERYQYDRTPDMKFLSFSMSKTITSMLIGIALQDRHIKSLDDAVSAYVPELKASAYGKVTIRQLLTMTSGVKWDDAVAGDNTDMVKLNECHMRHRGCESSLALLAQHKDFQSEPGSRFSYSGGDTMVLGHVLRAATKQDVTSYTQERLWSRLGAQGDAAWMIDKQGVENVFGHFAATMRDYGRLGMMMAERGRAKGDQLVPEAYWEEMTTPLLQASKPRVATSYFGYGYQLWLDPKPGVFCFRGLRGQAIYVDVPKNLVMVRLSVARFDDPNDSSERDWLWSAVRTITR
jgi:CubicO group peptidase (beta-lactamase class C family)